MKIKIPKTYEVSISSNQPLQSKFIDSYNTETETVIHGSLIYKDIKVKFKANANSTLDMQRLHELGYEDGEILEKTINVKVTFELKLDNNNIKQKYNNLDKTFKLYNLKLEGHAIEYPIISTIERSITIEIEKLIRNDPEFIRFNIK